MNSTTIRWLLVLGATLVLPNTQAACASAPSDLPKTPAGLSADSLEGVRHLAILHQGRLKPFDSYARETLKLISGSPRLGRQDPVATILSIAALPSEWAEAKIIAVPFIPLRKALGLGENTTHVSYNELVSTRSLMRMLPAIAEKQSRDEKLTMLEAETMDAYQRFVAFTELLQQDFPLVPPSSSHAQEWTPVLRSPLKESWESLVEAFRRGDAAQLRALSRHVMEEARRVNPGGYLEAWRLHLEAFYSRANPFALVRLLYGVAALLLLIGMTASRQPLNRLGMGVVLVACLLHAAGILTRVIVGGRPPVSNFYETMLWLPFAAVVLAIVFERIYRVGVFGLAASILAAIVLLLADYVPLDPSISPVVAVLRSNLWLTIHVLTIVASYGALGLAMVLAHLYGVQYLAQRPRDSATQQLGLWLYRAIQVGVVLLAGGIMLGAVWANASWGRYWGWDPKETWALITLLWFIAALHGRFAGWIKGVGVALATIAGFLLLLMTYYGVSFYLVGLHSYAGGHAKPIPPLLIAYLLAEAGFILLVGLAALRRRRLT
jgi:cytochrome c-type biogenesis protein CcsB